MKFIFVGATLALCSSACFAQYMTQAQQQFLQSQRDQAAALQSIANQQRLDSLNAQWQQQQMQQQQGMQSLIELAIQVKQQRDIQEQMQALQEQNARLMEQMQRANAQAQIVRQQEMDVRAKAVVDAAIERNHQAVARPPQPPVLTRTDVDAPITIVPNATSKGGCTYRWVNGPNSYMVCD